VFLLDYSSCEQSDLHICEDEIPVRLNDPILTSTDPILTSIEPIDT